MNLKKFFWSAIIAIFSSSCHEEVSDSNLHQFLDVVDYEFKVEDVSELGIGIKNGEAISIFSTDAPDENRKFVYEENKFTGVAVESGDFYCVYPYAATTSFSYVDGKPVFRANLLDVISLGDDTDEKSSNETIYSDMAVAKINDGKIIFHSLYTKFTLPVYAEYDFHIDRIQISGKNNEKLSGLADISFDGTSASINFSKEAKSVISYNCNIDISSGETKEIQLPIVPTNFSEGLTVTLYNGTSPTEKVYSQIEINATSDNRLENFVLSLPQYYIEYSGVEVVLPGYISQYNSDSQEGKIYFAQNEVPSEMLKSQEGVFEVNVPANIVAIGDEAFSGAKDLSVVNIGNVQFTYAQDSGNDDESDKVVTAVTTDSNLEVLGNNVFEGTQVSAIVLPQTIQDISNGFAGLESEYKVYCLSTVPPAISSEPFSDKLVSVYVPNDVLESYKQAWSSYAERITYIGNNSDIEIPIYYIKYKNSTALTEVVEGYEHTYDANTQTGYIYFETSEIPEKLFFESGKAAVETVEEITLSAKITKINSQSFRYAITRAFNVEEGSELESIEYYGLQGNSTCEFDFSNATKLKYIRNTALGECSKIMSYPFPESVIVLEQGVFRNLLWTDVIVKEGVEILGNPQYNGFLQGCKQMKKIDLPSTIKEIKQNGLKMDNNTDYIVICRAVTPPTAAPNPGTFFNDKLTALYVPDNSVDAYKSASGWSSVSAKIKPLSSLE